MEKKMANVDTQVIQEIFNIALDCCCDEKYEVVMRLFDNDRIDWPEMEAHVLQWVMEQMNAPGFIDALSKRWKKQTWSQPTPQMCIDQKWNAEEMVMQFFGFVGQDIKDLIMHEFNGLNKIHQMMVPASPLLTKKQFMKNQGLLREITYLYTSRLLTEDDINLKWQRAIVQILTTFIMMGEKNPLSTLLDQASEIGGC